MPDRRSVPVRFAGWLQACSLMFVWVGMVLALGAAVWQFTAQALDSPSAAWIWRGAAAHLLLGGIGLAALRILFHRSGPAGFLGAVVLSSLFIQGTAISTSDRSWRWTNDAQIFRQYLDRLNEEGYSERVLGELSAQYDYRVWTRRAQPFYLPLRRISGEHFVRALQMSQATLIALSLVLTWRVVRLWFGVQVAFWATSLQWLMPFRWFACLDFNHHLLGGFYYLAGWWILAEWFHGSPSPRRKWGLAACAALLVPLMRLEGGIDLVYIASITLVLALHAASRLLDSKRIMQAAGALLVAPLLLSTALLSPLDRCIDRADLHRHESGPIAFMARGWSPETGGEYCSTYEQMDYLTPSARKKPVQASILASQAFYNPGTLMFPLLPIKMAKYFLLGYAAGAEEMLNANGALKAKALVNGARAAFLIVALPLMIWGSILLLPLLRRTRRMALVLPCAAICATYVLLGETSPRYSIYIQPFLFMLAALPLAWPFPRQIRLGRAARPVAVWAVASLALAGALGMAALCALHPMLARHAFLDLREWNLADRSCVTPLPPTLEPLEIHLPPLETGAGTDWAPLDLPESPKHPGALIFYIFSEGASSALARQASLTATYTEGSIVRTQTNSLPGRFRMPYSIGARGRLALRTPRSFPYPLRVGYATYEFEEGTAE